MSCIYTCSWTRGCSTRACSRQAYAYACMRTDRTYVCLYVETWLCCVVFCLQATEGKRQRIVESVLSLLSPWEQNMLALLYEQQEMRRALGELRDHFVRRLRETQVRFKRAVVSRSASFLGVVSNLLLSLSLRVPVVLYLCLLSVYILRVCMRPSFASRSCGVGASSMQFFPSRHEAFLDRRGRERQRRASLCTRARRIHGLLFVCVCGQPVSVDLFPVHTWMDVCPVCLRAALLSLHEKSSPVQVR